MMESLVYSNIYKDNDHLYDAYPQKQGHQLQDLSDNSGTPRACQEIKVGPGNQPKCEKQRETRNTQQNAGGKKPGAKTYQLPDRLPHCRTSFLLVCFFFQQLSVMLFARQRNLNC